MSNPEAPSISNQVPPPTTPLSWRLAIAAGMIALALFAWFAQATIGSRGQAACGVVCFIGLIAACSQNLRAVNWRTVLCGFAMQIGLALFILKLAIPRSDGTHWRPGFELFNFLGQIIKQFLEFAQAGASFIFGNLANQEAMNKVFPPAGGFVFAFTALPTIIFVSSFFTVLYYFGVLQFIVKVMARGMIYLLGTSGAETLSAVANVFMGQTEAPLIVKPYVNKMTQSELLAMMVGGMATISGGVMAIYIQLGADPVAILATSVMAAPCGLYLAKLLLPETETPQTHGRAQVANEKLHTNAIDAAAAGASDGLGLALNVAAMLIAFLAFIALANALLGGIKPALLFAGLSAEGLAFWPDDLSLAKIFSWVFAPIAFLMGASSADQPYLADLLGTKLVANEFVSYVKLTTPAESGGYHGLLSPRGHVLATYALTGFANLSSIGIQLGGIGAIAPDRRGDLAKLGGRTLLAGFVATLINASIAGMLMSD